MKDFEFFNPVKILFGKGLIAKLRVLSVRMSAVVSELGL
jgi:alcohol dehydrogenase YqhD (iron-dependent ADH family)